MSRVLIQAFCSAFRRDDNCYLILKVNGRTEGQFDYEMVRARTNSDRVLFYEAALTRSQSYDFMASLDVYASLHRSEGFGLTCAEAMAMGLPVVASGYSGNMDFMRADNSLLVRTPSRRDRPAVRPLSFRHALGRARRRGSGSRTCGLSSKRKSDWRSDGAARKRCNSC